MIETKPIPARRVLRTKAVLEYCGISRTTLHRLMTKGVFPKPIELSDGGRPAWVVSELDLWIENRMKARDAA